MTASEKRTITDNTVDADILAYTVGDDPVLDLDLAVWDCMGTAAHVTMLSEMPLKRPIVTKREASRVRKALGRIAAAAEKGAFEIRVEDQDVHMAVERLLTEAFSAANKPTFPARSRCAGGARRSSGAPTCSRRCLRASRCGRAATPR